LLRNPCPFSAGIGVRFQQELLSAFSKNCCPLSARICNELYSKLLGNEKLIIGSLTYGHSKLDSINGIAYLKALENANRLADQILTKLPEKNKTITQVSNFEISRSESNPELNSEKFEDSKELDKSKLTINVGNMLAVQHLYVEYKIY
jgi:hypothetical protein